MVQEENKTDVKVQKKGKTALIVISVIVLVVVALVFVYKAHMHYDIEPHEFYDIETLANEGRPYDSFSTVYMTKVQQTQR